MDPGAPHQRTRSDGSSDVGFGDENSDYSSDSSSCQSVAAGPTNATTEGGRQRRADGTAGGALRLASAIPCLYKFDGDDGTSKPQASPCLYATTTRRSDQDDESLKDLIKYSPMDLLSRAWHLLPPALKAEHFPPFRQFPKCPHIFDVRMPDTNQVSQFMCAVALELERRYVSPTKMHLRAALVESVANGRMANSVPVALQSSVMSADIDPKWDDTDDLSAESWDESVDSDDLCSLDFSIALSAPALSSYITLNSLHLLHRFLNRSVEWPQHTVTQSWGARYAMQTVLRCLEKELAKPGADTHWLSAAFCLLLKFALMNGEVDLVLSLMRLCYHHQTVFRKVPSIGIKPFVLAVEACSSGRVRLPVPVDLSKGQTLSLENSLPHGTTHLKGIYVDDAGSDSYAILLTDNGAYKVALSAPFTVVAKNPFYTPDVCRGVFIEENTVVVVGNSGDPLDILDRDTLQKISTRQTEPRPTAFTVYGGHDRLVEPHFLTGGPHAKGAYFNGASVSGTFNQPNLALPRSCESLAVQFFLFPEMPAQPTTMTLVSATVGDRTWLSVTVALNPAQRSMKLTFRHGVDTVAEVEEPIRAEWTLWSATLTSVSEVASWTVYRNANTCEVQRRSGGFMRSDGLLTLSALTGTYTGAVAKVFLWSEAQRHGHLWQTAMHGQGEKKRDPSLLCALNMNEGNGCTLHCACSNLVWRGSHVGWKVAPKPPPFDTEGEKTIPWQPVSSYQIIWNGAELAVVEPTQTTWLSPDDGVVIEQQASNLEGMTVCFYSAFSGKLFFGLEDAFELCVIASADPPSSYVLGLESTGRGRAFCEAISERMMRPTSAGAPPEDTTTTTTTTSTTVTLTDFAQYTLFKLNSELLVGRRKTEEASKTCLWIKRTVSMRTVARLLSLCGEISTRTTSGTNGPFDGLLFCVCGKLLADQADMMGRQCPDAIVPRLLETCKFVEGCAADAFPFCADAKEIYSRLHSTVLARCVSHAYQLQLITQSESLKDVVQLLMPENVPALVTSVVEKGLKKPFMTLLNRLKEQCLQEAEDVFHHRPVQFRASEPTLLVILAVLSQKDNSQWHLVAVALISSLFKGVLRRFEQMFPDDNSNKLERAELLQQTALGVVAFPVVHYLLNMKFAPSIAGDVLKVLNDTRLCLQRYTPATDRPALRSHRFTETHSVVTPPGLQTAFSTSLDLQHAMGLQIELSCGGLLLAETNSASATLPVVSFALIDNECKRVSQSAHEGVVSFNRGGRLTIECNDVVAKVGMSAVIQATTELVMEEGDWMQDMVATLSQTIVHVINDTMDSQLIDEPPLRRDSFFRNGLAPATLEAHSIRATQDVEESLQNVRARLSELAESPPRGELVSFWTEMLAQRAFPYLARIGDLVRVCTCAIVWHTLATPTVESVKETMASVLDWMKRKTFLLLEVHQQGREADVLLRGLFLLNTVMPRSQGESQLADQQPTEEALTSSTGRAADSRRLSRGGGAGGGVTRLNNHRDVSMGHRSRADVSYRALGAETLDFSTGHRYNTGFTTARRDRRNAAAMNIFRNQLLTQTESLPNQLLNFLINPGEDVSVITDNLLARTRVAAANTAAFKLQEELCDSRRGDYRLVSTQLNSFLQYRLALGQSSRGRRHHETTAEESGSAAAHGTGSGNATSTTTATTAALTSAPEEVEGFDCHYMEQVIGCGLVRELEMQRAVCSFVQAALRSLLRPSQTAALPLRDAVQMCAVLCHPWDAVDMSILSPTDIFTFLKILLHQAFGLIAKSREAAPSSGTGVSSATYLEGRGLLDMAHRCLILPNSLLQVSHDGVQIVDGEVEGLHVEDVDIVCCARNHWKAFANGPKLDVKGVESDLYANYGVPCVVTELPDVQYFEITIDLSVHEGPQVAIGLTSIPLMPTELWKPETSFAYASDGMVWGCSTAPISFSEPWSVGDVVGCGILAPHNSVFFTRNGRFLGVAKDSKFATHIPFVNVKGRGSLLKVIVNFGEESPFKFNIASLNVSVRSTYLTGATVADAALITVDYLLTMCYKNLEKDDSDVSALNREAVSGLLERAASFLRSTMAHFVYLLNERTPVSDGEVENINCSLQEPVALLVARLFHCVTVAMECFRFDAVTVKTQESLLNLCTHTLDAARDRWVKVRAANCLSLFGDVAREQALPSVSDSLKGIVPAEAVVQRLVELARVKTAKEALVPPPPPRWGGNNGTLAVGKGAFFGAAPMPAKGRHTVGFRIRRRAQQGQGVGAPLGGCYYVGLCHGQPQISNMGSLIGRDDVYVLQDTDDHDQVAHLLLRRHAIPRNNTRRVYGHEEAVWVELNADAGEITFYREDMILIGLAFAGIQRVDDLYPIVFHFNDDATCEILPPPPAPEDPTDLWIEHYRRSSAIRALQRLHLVPYFSSVVSEMVQRSVVLADRSVESCLVALAVLGGERSYLFAQHDTFGLVVVHGIADVTRKIVVYLASDDEMRLLAVTPETLKPSFVQTPLFASGSPEAEACASLLTTELHRTVHEASVIVPLIKQEQTERDAIEREYARESEQSYAMDLMCLIQEFQCESPRYLSRTASTSLPPQPTSPSEVAMERAQLSALMVPQSTPTTILFTPPYVVERRYSSKSVYTPNPSIAATSTEEAVIIRGNAVFEASFTIAISITSRSLAAGELMYVGLTTSTTTPLAAISELAPWEDTWALCSVDSAQTNSINCAVEPGMIFSDVNLFTSGDVVIMEVDRIEGSVSFSRARGGKTVQFGALFENIPAECDLRPVIACGGGTVVVFSFSDGRTFPARNTYPVSNFPEFTTDASSCSACHTPLRPPWYMGERNRVALCEFCFKTWQHAKDMFCVAQVPASAPSIPLYMASTRAPATLSPGEYVEFEENTVLSWCRERSVNAQLEGFDCVSVRDECFAVTELLPAFGNARVDIALGHVVGIAGNPFAGIMPFTPQWRDEDQTGTAFAMRGDSLQVSVTLLPSNARLMLSLTFADCAYGAHTTPANIFIGLTTQTDSVSSLTRPDLEKEHANSTLWGTWCDTTEKISADGRVILLVDTIHRVLIMSSTLQGLHSAPFIVNCGSPSAVANAADEESTLRLAVYSQEACRVEVEEGLMSYGDSIDPSCCPVAFGLVSEDFNAPRLALAEARSAFSSPSSSAPSVSAPGDDLDDRTLLMDTVHGSDVCSPAVWTFSKHALLFNEQQSDDSLFRIDDTLTLLQHGRVVEVFCQGLLIASTTLSEQQARRRHRFFLYLSVRGCTARFVPPLFGRTRLGQVVRTHGPEVCVVECASDTWEKQQMTVRRRDVRFCAQVATSFPPSELVEGTKIAFRVTGIQHPKRGTLLSTTGIMASIDDSSDERAAVWVKLNECFVLTNEGSTPARQPPYPLILPPSNAVTHVFEVGKSKFRLTSRGSYNGIVFDCKAAEKIDLVSVSVLSHTTGRQRVELFFKRGSHRNHERDPKSWTSLFADFVDLHAEQPFTLTFPAVSIDAGIFALYVNTSHNCGVGFYCEEDGCSGEVGSEMDDDGTLVVYLGRKSGSSTAFGELSVTSRGFCGSLVYRQNKGCAPPLIEMHMPPKAPSTKIPKDSGDVVQLVSHPRDLALQSVASFQVEVLKLPIRLLRLCTPIVLRSATTESGAAQGLRHCIVTLYCATLPSHQRDDGTHGEHGEGSRKAESQLPQPAHPHEGGSAAPRAVAPAEAENRGGSGWRCVWRARVLLDGETTNVDITNADLALAKGVHAFAVTAENELGEPVQWAHFLTTPSASFTRQNHLIATRGFFGEILAEADTPAVLGEQHTMTTGAFLNQHNSASYNGIMFDLRSKEDITLEEIQCISQTTADRVMVRVFWKEGSMEGAERSLAQWREVASQELALVDKEPFSPGSLFLRMKANRVYSIFVNTSSSCGVRFYNSSDGRVGDIGDEFENDGILSVYVGRKSESSLPFTDLPKEPRAFRGKLLYITFVAHPSKRDRSAMFSYMKAFIVTRMLVALASFVDCASSPSTFSYKRLLPMVKALATSPFASISDIDGVEEALVTLLKETSVSDLKTGIVTIPLARRVLIGDSLAIGDLALLTDVTGSGAGTLVRVASTPQSDGTVSVCNDEQTEAYQVQAKRLLPLVKCWLCGQPYASRATCAHTGALHRPMQEEDERVICALAGGIMAKHRLENISAAVQIARKQLNSCRAETHAASAYSTAPGDEAEDGDGAADNATTPTLTDTTARVHVTQGYAPPFASTAYEMSAPPMTEADAHAPCALCFTIPTSELLSEGASMSFVCPFSYVAGVMAWVSLEYHVGVDGVTVDVLCVADTTSFAPRPAAPPRVLRAVVELLAPPEKEMETVAASVALYLSAETPATSRRALTLLNAATCATAADGATDSVCFRVSLAAMAAPLDDSHEAAAADALHHRLPGEVTPVVAAEAGVWRWSDGSFEAELHSPNPTFLSGSFAAQEWPASRQRFCAFAVHSKGKEKTVFLEAHVVETAKPARVWETSRIVSTHTRKPFSVRCGEVLTLGFSHEGEFFVCDTDDAIRCRITPDELVPSHKDGTIAVGFVCIDQHMVRARLLSPRRAHHARLHESAATASAETTASSPGEGYAPQWVRFDSSQVTLSKNKMTALCSGDVGGQVVIGTALPLAGVSAFVLQIDRRDRSLGAPLGSGHFAGVAVSSFPTLTTHFSEMKKSALVWAVQDVQDEDSLPGQNPVPPMERDGATNELYAVGTKLLFVVDRSAGTVSLARGSESPRIVFQGLPGDAAIAPFVRLDHTSASATLSKFSHSSIYRVQYQPSLLKTVLSQPLTPTLLRRYPLYAVMEQFPLVRLIVDTLPLAQASTLRRVWQRQGTHSRFELRVAAALEALLEAGVLSRGALQCDEDTCFDLFQQPCVVTAIRQLSTTADSTTTAAFPGVPPIVFELPPEYEVIGRVDGTDMLRVLCLDSSRGPAEQTLHLVRLDDANHPTVLGWTEGLLPHGSTAHHRCVLPSASHPYAVAVMFDGWFDMTLETALARPLSLRSAHTIASQLLCAVEHWHLHGRVHGHVQPANVYVHVVDGEVEGCVLWNGCYLSHCHSYASPRLRETGARTMTDDLWSCSRILFELTELLSTDVALMECAKLLEAGKTSISDALLQSNALQDQNDEDIEGPVLTLRTGGRMRGGSGSYNGIMFDVVAKHASICITSLAFVPDTNSSTVVSLYMRDGGFQGFETHADAWKKVCSGEVTLADSIETPVTGFEPIVVPAGGRIGLFLHTTNGSGVLFYSEGEGVQAKMGMVEEENNDIGITVGKKSESSQPFTAIQNQKRLLKGSISYRLMTRSSGPRSMLIYNEREGRMEKAPTKSADVAVPCVVTVDSDARSDGALVVASDATESQRLVVTEDGHLAWRKNGDVHARDAAASAPLSLAAFEKLLWPLAVKAFRQRQARHLLATSDHRSFATAAATTAASNSALTATGSTADSTTATAATTSTAPSLTARALLLCPVRHHNTATMKPAVREEEEEASGAAHDLDASVTHPKIADDDAASCWYVSEVLPRRCVVSIWQSDPAAAVEVYLLEAGKAESSWCHRADALSSAAASQSLSQQPELMAGKKRLFLHVDSDLASVRVSTRKGLLPLTTTTAADSEDGGGGQRCGARPLRVAVRLVSSRRHAQPRRPASHADEARTAVKAHESHDVGPVPSSGSPTTTSAGSDRRARSYCQTFAYVSVPPSESVMTIGQNTAIVRLPGRSSANPTTMTTTTTTRASALMVECGVGSSALRLSCAPSPALPAASAVSYRRTLQGPPDEDMLATALVAPSSAQALASPSASLCQMREGSAVPIPGDAQFLCVHAAVRNESRTIRDFQLFCPHAASVEIRNRSVRQIAASTSCRCSVLSPAVMEGETHTVTLRLVFSARMPIELMLENPNAPNQSLVLPFHVEPLIDNPLGFCSDVVEQVVMVRIDTQAKRMLVFSSSGAVSDALCGKTCPTKGQLAFELHTAGASVEILDWQCTTVAPQSTIEAPAIAAAAARTGVDAHLSFNITPTVGTLTRHTSHRPSHMLTRDKRGAPVTAKQMEVLIVSYARLLLEKSLIAQEAARQTEHLSLLYSLSYTSLRTSARIVSVLESEHKHSSFELLSQACRYLSLPTVLQSVTGVETAINVVCHALEVDHVKSVLIGAFVESLAVLLLRTAITYSRRIRHTALRCAQKLLSNEAYPLPSHEMLCAHLGPLVSMMAGLCKHEKQTAAAVQIGVTLIADLTIRYQKHRPSLRPPGHDTCIPYEVVICARALINAITHDPPLPLPAAFVRDLKEPHRITCEIVAKPAKGALNPCFATFTEHNRKTRGEKIMVVKINGSRQGMVAIGWDLEVPGVNPRTVCEQEDQPLPSCGYCIDALLGNVYVCLARRRETKALKKTAKPGDVVVVKCSYQEQMIQVSLLRAGHLELCTNFALAGDEIALPFFSAQNSADAEVDCKYLGVEKLCLDIPQMCADFVSDASTEEEVPAQSLDFYAELNLFCQNALETPVISALLSTYSASSEGHGRPLSVSSSATGPSAPSHEVAGYPLLSNFLEVGAYAKEVPLSPLMPYLFRLQLFDAIMRAFSPLINLKRQSELFEMFGVLKNLCSRQTEETIQNGVMQPFSHRAGRKVHVTIHSMQAQPSASLGPFQTLVRSIFGQLYVQLHRTPIDTFYSSPMFAVKLAGFGSSDAGGPYRDVLTQLATEVMTAHPSGAFQMNPLFMQCGKGGASAIMPNVDLLSNGQVPLMLEFFGKLLAAFFLTADVFPVEFPPLFWKLLLREDTTVKDLLNLDADIMSLLSPIELMQRSAEELEERFPGISSAWLGITQENAHLFLDEALPPETLEGAQLLSERMARSELDRFAESIECIQFGFSQVLPLYTLQAFRWQRVEVLICGTKKLSFEAFKKECEIQLPVGEAEMFYTVLESMTDEDRTSLLRFTTGQSRLPLKTRIKVQHGGMKNSLPTSSTCFFTLRLPLYTTAEIMKERILYAARQCKAIDADGQARENLILDG